MSRPSRTLCTAVLLAVSFAASGCGTIYTRTYSPRRSYYEKPPEKLDPSAAELLATPQLSQGQAPMNSPGTPTGPAVPPVPEAAPAIPGL